MAGEVDAVVAAPQHETSIAQAGIKFDGHPSFVARQTGTDENGVYMMLCFGDTRIAHCTLHRSVREAIALITRENVARTIRATDVALQRLGIGSAKIAVSGLNPHAGEGGLFGQEEIEIIKPAMDQVAAEGMNVAGPFGADTMFHMPGFDAFVVMLHDQGHIATKLLAQNAAAALTIGTPILFASVAHGTGHDIAGKGIANPAAMIEAVLRLAKARSGRRTGQRALWRACSSASSRSRPAIAGLDAAGVLDQLLDGAGDRQRQPGLVGHLGDDLHVLQRPGEGGHVPVLERLAMRRSSSSARRAASADRCRSIRRAGRPRSGRWR